MPLNFTAIDFETAQGPRWSICQVGLVRVEDGEIVRELELLVQPPDNYYNYYNTRVHGIDAYVTAAAPFFDALWPELEPYIHGQTVVAHNGGFDFSCLRKTLEYYGMDEPEYDAHCTVKLYKKKHSCAKLDYLCDCYGIELNHHEALSDARACAQLFKMHAEDTALSL